MDDDQPVARPGEDRLMVELVGGPWDGHRQELMRCADLMGPREALGVWMVVEGSQARAEYTPDPPPAPATRWVYRGPINA